ncbi:MAG: alpha/beta hydrolase [Ilumatobacteraceae bacterium]
MLADLFGPADGSHRPVLVGHSLGGYLALAHAITRPGVDRGLVVLNTGPGSATRTSAGRGTSGRGATPTSSVSPRR